MVFITVVIVMQVVALCLVIVTIVMRLWMIVVITIAVIAEPKMLMVNYGGECVLAVDESVVNSDGNDVNLKRR